MEISKDLQSCFKNLITAEDEIFSDYTVVVEDKTFPCHRFVLSACSLFFRGLFRSDIQNKNCQSFELKEISSEAFRLIYRFLYHHDSGLNELNFVEVWNAARFLQIDFIVSTCQNFVMENINERNCYRYFWYAKLLDKSCMVKILQHITYNFDQYKVSKCIMELEGEELLSIVRDPDLKTSREENVVDTILKWVSHSPCDKSLLEANIPEILKKDIETISHQSMTASYDRDNNRANYLKSLLSVSRLGSLSVHYLKNLISHTLIKDHSCARNIIFRALMYISGYRLSYFTTFACHRKCSQWEDVVLMPSMSKSIMVYSMTTKKMIGKLDLSVLPHGAVLFLNKGLLYACGYADNKKDSLSIYMLFNDFWEYVTDLQVCDEMSLREHTGQKTLLYFIIEERLFVLDVKNGAIFTWNFIKYMGLNQVTSVPSGLPIVFATPYESFSFLVICRSLNTSCMLNVYDIRRQKWFDTVAIQEICVGNISSFHKDDKLYLLTADGKLSIIETVGGYITFKHVTTVSNFSYKLIGALVYFEDLFLFVKECLCTSKHKNVSKEIEIPVIFKQGHVIAINYSCTSLVPTNLTQDIRNLITL